MRRFRLMQLLLPLMLCLLSACQPIVAPPAAAGGLDSETVAALEALLDQGMAEYHIPGLALGVVKDGQLVYARGFGIAELGSDRPVTPQSVFLLSSIAKTVTSTAVMQLVEQGKISLDAPVTDYLPYFQLADERYQAITIRHLLSHTAGLPEYDYADMAKPENDDGALERYVRSLRDLELLSLPGEQWGYSGIGFDILGDVIAKVSGQSFEDYTVEHIFEPLGMKHSTFLLEAVDPALLVSPHVPDGNGNVVVGSFFPYNRSHAPDTTLFSNVEDMARYALAHLNQGELNGVRILANATYDETWKQQAETYFVEPEAGEHGLGWVMGPYQGHRLISYLGLDEGFNTYLALFPEEGIGYVLLVNYAHLDPVDGSNHVIPVLSLARPIFDLLLGIEPQ